MTRVRLSPASGLRRIIGDTGRIVVGRYSQFIVTLITVPLVARALGVDEVGHLGVGTSSVFLGSIVVDWGLTQILASRHSQGVAGLGTARSLSPTALAANGPRRPLLSADHRSGYSRNPLGRNVRRTRGRGLIARRRLDLYRGRQIRQLATIQIATRILYLAAIPVVVWISPHAWSVMTTLFITNLLGAGLVDALRAFPVTMMLARCSLLKTGAPLTASKLLAALYGIASTVM